jgi:hypothetical protein
MATSSSNCDACQGVSLALEVWKLVLIEISQSRKVHAANASACQRRNLDGPPTPKKIVSEKMNPFPQQCGISLAPLFVAVAVALHLWLEFAFAWS